MNLKKFVGERIQGMMLKIETSTHKLVKKELKKMKKDLNKELLNYFKNGRSKSPDRRRDKRT